MVERCAAAATAGDLVALGRAFDDNLALLETLGVSSDEIAELVAAARRAEALGAKLNRWRRGRGGDRARVRPGSGGGAAPV